MRIGRRSGRLLTTAGLAVLGLAGPVAVPDEAEPAPAPALERSAGPVVRLTSPDLGATVAPALTPGAEVAALGAPAGLHYDDLAGRPFRLDLDVAVFGVVASGDLVLDLEYRVAGLDRDGLVDRSVLEAGVVTVPLAADPALRDAGRVVVRGRLPAVATAHADDPLAFADARRAVILRVNPRSTAVLSDAGGVTVGAALTTASAK